MKGEGYMSPSDDTVTPMAVTVKYYTVAAVKLHSVMKKVRGSCAWSIASKDV